MREYLYTYRTDSGAYADIWAPDAESTRDRLKASGRMPRGFFTLYRATNVPSRVTEGK